MEIPSSARRKVRCVFTGRANRPINPKYVIALLSGDERLSCLRKRALLL